jgi:hypothetical protein
MSITFKQFLAEGISDEGLKDHAAWSESIPHVQQKHHSSDYPHTHNSSYGSTVFKNVKHIKKHLEDHGFKETFVKTKYDKDTMSQMHHPDGRTVHMVRAANQDVDVYSSTPKKKANS